MTQLFYYRLNSIKVKALLFLAGLLLFSCNTSKKIDKNNVVVYGCIIAKSDNPTMKGYKYYIIINNSLDSFYSSSRDFRKGECYPFHVKR